MAGICAGLVRNAMKAGGAASSPHSTTGHSLPPILASQVLPTSLAMAEDVIVVSSGDSSLDSRFHDVLG